MSIPFRRDPPEPEIPQLTPFVSDYFYGNMVPGDVELPDGTRFSNEIVDGVAPLSNSVDLIKEQYGSYYELWVNTLPYDEPAKQALRENFDLAITDYLTRVRAAQNAYVQAGGDYSAAIQLGYVEFPSFPQYVANLNADGFLYSVNKTVFYQNAIEGMTGLSQVEQNLLAQHAYDLAMQYGIRVPDKQEMLETLRHLDPGFGFQAFVSESGLSPEEQNRLTQLFNPLYTQAENQGIRDFYRWVSQQPARQLLLEYDPSYALNQYIAGQQLSSSQQAALRNNYDALAQQWRDAGQPGSFYSWLGSQNAAELAGSVSTEQAYSDWISVSGRTLNATGQSNLNRAYDRELARYQALPDDQRPKTFQDYIKQRKPGDVSLGQSPADLGHVIGRTRWLSF